jgi:hypothetical protein
MVLEAVSSSETFTYNKSCRITPHKMSFGVFAAMSTSNLMSNYMTFCSIIEITDLVQTSLEVHTYRQHASCFSFYKQCKSTCITSTDGRKGTSNI